MKDARYILKSYQQNDIVHTVQISKRLLRQKETRRTVGLSLVFKIAGKRSLGKTRSNSSSMGKGQQRSWISLGKVFALTTLLALLFVTLISLPTSLVTSRDLPEGLLAEVIVGKGDTLWSIAKSHHRSRDDIRELIFYIKELNQLQTAQIRPGQELVIPAMD